jgi:hypothetical protein
MSFLHSSILYVHFKIIFKIIYLQCYKNFSFKRVLWTTIFVTALMLVTLLVLIFRLFDEIFFFNYRNVKVEDPIFIISNPRSGTTFMHRLMSMDEGKYGYTYLYHTLFSSITIFKIVGFLGRVDKKIGQPMERFVKVLDNFFFKGWEDIHPMGFGKTEEDEALYVFTGMSGGIFFLCPFIKELYDVIFPDKMENKKSRDKIMNYYTNTIKRVMFVAGHNKIFLSKNVMSTGRVYSLLEAYPNARFIYLVRNPIQSIPSLISMFSIPWSVHSPEIASNSPEFRAWGEVGMDYYKYFDEFKSKLNPKQIAIVKYDDLVGNPKKTIEEVYNHFGLNISAAYAAKLTAVSNTQKEYKSKHDYDLADYGMTEEQVYEELKPIFTKYGFETLKEQLV